MPQPDQASGHSPVLTNAISEVHGLFTTDAALQDAVGKLTLAGFDRAELSLPAASPHPADATPAAGAAPVGTETDTRQMRTLLTSTAGVAAAMGAAGVTIATGGAAAAVFAAAAGGAAIAGGATAAATSAAGEAQEEARDQAAASGELVLAVRTPTDTEASRAEALLHEAGAVKVERVVREGAGIA